MTSLIVAEVILIDANLNLSLDYQIVESDINVFRVGTLIEVNVRNKKQKAIIYKIKNSSNFKNLKKLNFSSDVKLVHLPLDLLKLADFIADYYGASKSESFKLLFPPEIKKGMADKEQYFVNQAKPKQELIDFCIQNRNKKPAQVKAIEELLKQKKGLLLTKLLEASNSNRQAIKALEKAKFITLQKLKIDRSPIAQAEYFITKPKLLNEAQKAALEKISSSIAQGSFAVHLLFGVTGSGKTEVYLQAIRQALDKEKQVLMLVPEIALTNQTIERFKSRFKERISILHHRLSPGERNDEWHKINSGQTSIVIGARSAIFSPLQNIGLIIVDEEHEQSFKQSDFTPRYSGKDVAIFRAKLCQATIILGSATPSLESFYNAETHKYTLSILSARAKAQQLPKVKIVDMLAERENKHCSANFSTYLLDAITDRLKKNEQIILFLNRRGYHTNLSCPTCQKAVKCYQCDIALTFHLKTNHLTCHLCDFQISPPPTVCQDCKQGQMLKFKGVGTEQIEKAIRAIFPQAQVLRMDADTTKHKGSHEKILKDFGTQKADILIGTQMIAKGLHFPEVTLVGVLNSDSALNIPDFRSAEYTFQLITQVAGRAGRGENRGEVIIQTYMPNNEVIQLAASQNYLEFYSQEINVRKIFTYPPFKKITKVVFTGKNDCDTLKFAQDVRSKLLNNLPSSYEFFPVIKCGHAKVKEYFRYQFIIKSQNFKKFHELIQNIRRENRSYQGMKLSIDVDPTSTFF